ncbi:MAG: DUF3226 domain-containing protein [Lachnospiraceae bacterium]|nr:DUF3226 domain-containing protein [Lachnospiraceae bacterium]
MKNIMLCEGSTDFILLQYFMRKAYNWQDSKEKILQNSKQFTRVRTLVKNENTLTIAGTGGCNKMIGCLKYLLEMSKISGYENEPFQKIAVMIDRDEITTEEEFKAELKQCLDEESVIIENDIVHNEWFSVFYENVRGEKKKVSILLLIIPFEETGALETFLLNAIAKKDTYDAELIKQCNQFVETVDIEKRYLNKRRYLTKSKFDVYFSIRTAAEQFVERQNILKNINWEDYEEIQNSFKKLKELSN